MAVRNYRVAFAGVGIEGLYGQPEVFKTALAESWAPGAETTRYGRTWRISAPHQRDGVWVGRLGFVREDDLATVDWDDETKEFVRGTASGGTVVPFALALDSQIVGFQLHAGEVRSASFTGAFEKLLRESGTYAWTVQQLVVERTFEQWRRQVAAIKEFRFRLERPNPHYHDNEVVENLIEQMRLAVSTVSGQGDDINETAPQFQQFLDHVRREHGHGLVRGTDDEGQVSEWWSTQRGVVPAVERVEAEGDEEIPEAELIAALDRADEFSERFTYPDAQADDEV